jgi:SAM-dependent methyltransferase
MTELPWPDKRFDLVCALDILYHRGVENDEDAIREAYRVLKPGGRLIVTTSAMKCLFGKNDIVQHGARRHTREELIRKCSNAGFIHERSSYYTVTFFPLVYIIRKIQDMSGVEPVSDIDESINPLVNSMCLWWFKREVDMLRFVTYPFGVHLFGTFLKPADRY